MPRVAASALLPADLDRALAGAVLCQALQQGLASPERGTVRTFRSAAGRRALEQAAALMDGDEPATLRPAVAALTRHAPLSFSRLRRAYARLFGHTLRGHLCPYGCEYGEGAPLQQAQELADLAGFYLAFGLRLAPGAAERPDHVACQMEFLRFLFLKEAHARGRGDAEMLEVTRQAQRAFLRRHLGRFGCAFAASLEEADPDGFYGHLGRALEVFLRSACARLAAPVGPHLLELRPADFDDAPMACGSGSELVQLGAPRPTLDGP